MTAYSDTPTASGGVAPYTYSISAGSLPPGLSINSGTGLISGTTEVGSADYTFTVSVTDANGCPGSQEYTIVVNEFFNLLAREIAVGSNLTGDLPNAYKTAFKSMTAQGVRTDLYRVGWWVADNFAGVKVPVIFNDDGSSTPIGGSVDAIVAFLAANWGQLTGLQGTGAAALQTGVIPDSEGIPANDLTMGVWNYTTGSSIGIPMGCYSAGTFTLIATNIGGNTWFPIGQNGNVFVANALDTGLIAGTRDGDNDNKLYVNGSLIDTQNVAGNMPGTVQINIFRSDDTVGVGDYYSGRLGGYFIAKGMNATKMAAWYNIWAAFDTAIGKS